MTTLILDFLLAAQDPAAARNLQSRPDTAGTPTEVKVGLSVLATAVAFLF